jgi:nucleoporin POM152
MSGALFRPNTWTACIYDIFSSGDTGVEATLLLHGTPPFHVYYTMQRDKEPPRELVKAFSSARGEMTLQPPYSGHYLFTFTHISDANYQKVPLQIPSIDQTVHPLASASFVSTGHGKQTLDSCSGDTVDVDVDLTVSFLSPPARRS